MGAADRARGTLPPELEIRKSEVPEAGLGVFNKGATVPVGAHFGPYQGDPVDREEAMNSGYSWVVSYIMISIKNRISARVNHILMTSGKVIIKCRSFFMSAFINIECNIFADVQRQAA